MGAGFFTSFVRWLDCILHTGNLTRYAQKFVSFILIVVVNYSYFFQNVSNYFSMLCFASYSIGLLLSCLHLINFYITVLQSK